MIGEVFQEDRKLAQMYEAVLLEVAEGKWNLVMVVSKLSPLSLNSLKVSSDLDTFFKMDLIKMIKAHRGEGRPHIPLLQGTPVLRRRAVGRVLRRRASLCASRRHRRRPKEKDKPFIAYEVKNSFSGREAEKAVERIKAFGIPRAALVSTLEDHPPRTTA